MDRQKWIYQKQANGVFLAVTTCTKCGTVYNNGNVAMSLYCPPCALDVKRAKTRERVRKHREKAKGAQS